jgi:methylthioribose-1-phosphate isomerase
MPGAIATVGWALALAPVDRLHEQGIDVHVWVDETRPRNQGASLTAWELGRAAIAHTVITDNAGRLLMMRGEVDAVIVGCDRVAANGDVANKVGTYLKALAARAHRVPSSGGLPDLHDRPAHRPGRRDPDREP